jgi:hypothetical protein
MSNIAREPIFCVVLGDAENWSVEAEWPDGTIEPVHAFKAYFEAMNWVRTQSQLWLQVRTADSSFLHPRRARDLGLAADCQPNEWPPGESRG